MGKVVISLGRLLSVALLVVAVVGAFYVIGAMQPGRGAVANLPPEQDYCDDPNRPLGVPTFAPQPGWELPADPRVGLTVVAGPPLRATSVPAAAMPTSVPSSNLSFRSKALVPPQPPDDRYLVRQSTVIAIVTVVDCGAPRWLTPGNQKPTSPDRHAFIYRPITLRVEQVVKGAQPGDVFTVEAGGGTLDGETQVVEPYSPYYRGARLLVLLGASGIAPDGTRVWPVEERDVIDASNIATDELYPNRRWPVGDRLQQLRTAMGVSD